MGPKRRRTSISDWYAPVEPSTSTVLDVSADGARVLETTSRNNLFDLDRGSAPALPACTQPNTQPIEEYPENHPQDFGDAFGVIGQEWDEQLEDVERRPYAADTDGITERIGSLTVSVKERYVNSVSSSCPGTRSTH